MKEDRDGRTEVGTALELVGERLAHRSNRVSHVPCTSAMWRNLLDWAGSPVERNLLTHGRVAASGDGRTGR